MVQLDAAVLALFLNNFADRLSAPETFRKVLHGLPFMQQKNEQVEKLAFCANIAAKCHQYPVGMTQEVMQQQIATVLRAANFHVEFKDIVQIFSSKVTVEAKET